MVDFLMEVEAAREAAEAALRSLTRAAVAAPSLGQLQAIERAHGAVWEALSELAMLRETYSPRSSTTRSSAAVRTSPSEPISATGPSYS